MKNHCHNGILKLSFNVQLLLIGKIFICYHVRPLLQQNVTHFNTVLNIVLYLDKIILKFGKVKSPFCLFCKSAEETIINLFSECLCAQNIWNQAQIFFSGYITIPDVTPQSAIFGFTDTSIEHFLLINYLLLIYKCYLFLKLETHKI